MLCDGAGDGDEADRSVSFSVSVAAVHSAAGDGGATSTAGRMAHSSCDGCQHNRTHPPPIHRRTQHRTCTRRTRAHPTTAVCPSLLPPSPPHPASVSLSVMAASATESLLTLVGHGESPGRLDFMGGVADYSGSLVLQMPIRGKTRVEVTYLPQPIAYLESVGFDKYHYNMRPLRDLLLQYHAQPAAAHPPGSPSESAFLAAVKAHLDEEKVPGWCKYVLGCFTVFSVRKGWMPGAAAGATLSSSSSASSSASSSSSSSPAAASVGLRFLINSEVNPSMGVSSSAAIEVATIRALASLAQHTSLALSTPTSPSPQLTFHPTEMAHLGQLAENRIVGAPCGLMDQLSVAYGKPLHLLPILCRPDTLYPNVPLPDDVVAVGWPSGIKHSVGENPYSVARAAAFMGKRMMEEIVGVKVRFTAEFSPSTLLAPPTPLPMRHQRGVEGGGHAHDEHKPYVSRLSLLPISMLGADFTRQFTGVDDALSVIKPELYYPVRDAFHFPIAENFRCQLVASLLSSLQSQAAGAAAAFDRQSVLQQIGELLYQSHRGYSAMGLGCAETDAIISILQGMRAEGVYGGRISGGGSGGTVLVLCDKKAVEAVRRQLKAFHSSAALDLIVA